RERTTDLARVNAALQQEVSERSQSEATLRAIVEGVEAEVGDRFFHSLVLHLADAPGARYAFVSELSEDRTRFRTLAVCGRGDFLDNFEIPPAGTPGEPVLNGEAPPPPAALQALFPDDKGLPYWKAESYCGGPRLDASGTV